ncbi:MAG: methyl-accepting chemotaxis protein [bacterium]|nr:methyl-accepting chemotaxis protein [bacterium]
MNNIKISTKLIILILISSTILVIVGLYGISGLRKTNTGMETMYKDRVVPLKQLKVVADALAVNIVDATHKAKSKTYSFSKANKEVGNALDILHEQWDSYMATFMEGEELRIAQEVTQMLKEAEDNLKKLDEILEIEDSAHRAQLEEFIVNELYQTIDPISEKISELTELQLNISKTIYDEAQVIYKKTQQNAYILMTAGLLIAIFLSIYIISGIIRATRLVNKNVKNLAKGDLSVTELTDIRKDELGEILNNVKIVGRTLEEFQREMNHMSGEHDAGDIDIRIDETKFDGAYYEMVEGVNKMVMGHIDVNKKAMACVNELGNGNFDAPLEQFPGKKIFINETIENVRVNLKEIGSELNSLIDASKVGALQTRGKASKYSGDWEKLIDGVNEMLDAILKPIQEANRVLQLISKGDLTEKIVLNLQGEHRDLQNAVNGVQAWLANMVSIIKLIANGDLTVEVKKLSTKDELSETLQKMVTSLSGIVTEIVLAADNVAAGSNEISKNSNQIASGSNEQGSSVEEVSTSMEEMKANIDQNTENAVITEKTSRKAAEDIDSSSKSVIETVEAMKTIAEKITIVTDIAEKTDLLAINAAIEAARAGEHGEGFAVVAAEVRKLAEQSQQAAKEINDLSKNSVRIAEISGDQLVKIVPDIQKTAKLVKEIASAGGEQTSNAEQVNNALQLLSGVTQQNSSNAEELSTGAEELASQAEQMRSVIGFFEIKKDRKLKAVRTIKNVKPQFANSVNNGSTIDLTTDNNPEVEFESY